MIAQKQTKVSDSSLRFVELPPPSNEMQQASEEKRVLIASVRIGNASLEVYGGASAEIVSVLCRVLNHAE